MRQRTVLSALLTALLLFLIFPQTSINAQEEQYRRWLDDGKVFTCTDTGSDISVNLSNQNVEFNNLPADAQFTINYISNGVLTTDGPYTVEQTSGTRSYSMFSATFPAYPLTFEFRLDTLIDGVPVYQSTVSVTCTADATFSATPVNLDLTLTLPVPVPVVCPTPLPADAVQGRLLSTVTALFSPNPADTTNIILPAGSAWFVIGAQDGFYRLYIACQAAALWIPADAISPNYEPPWNGAPLPTETEASEV